MIKSEDSGFLIFGEKIKVKAAEYAFRNISAELQIALFMLRTYSEHGNLPEKGGLLDQDPMFFQCLQVWEQARVIFNEQKEKVKGNLKKLGAYKK